MNKALALAILGTAMLLPMAASADAPLASGVSGPAFVRATACEAAAPIRAESLFQRRAVRATIPRKGAISAETSAQAPDQAPEEAGDASLLRRAVHFCAVATGGRVYRT